MQLRDRLAFPAV